jgi:arylsulfatase A-like enzyme
MILKYILFPLSVCALWSACNKSIDSNKIPEKPNVVFILVDDLGAHDLGYSGSKYYQTPHIDALSEKAAIFTRGYSASRVCSPSRASIMTGQFTARHGITDWIGARTGTAWRTHNRHDLLLPAEYEPHLAHGDSTLAEVFRAGGYQTFYAGKWHLGSEGSYPEDHGFDINVGGWEKGSPIGGYYAPWENPRLDYDFEGENLTTRLAQETASFIREDHNKPFFAFLSFYAVHGPIQTTYVKWEKYRQRAEEMGIDSMGFDMERVLPIRTKQDNPVYAGLVETMDDAVGIVMQSLKETGLDKNTIVVFTSDNGGVASGDAYSTTNAPLRGGKGYQWEGGIRVPLLIRVPWKHEKPKTIESAVTGSDLFPTLLDLCSIEFVPDEDFDGVSIAPLLDGKNTIERSLIWHYPHYGNQGGEPSSIVMNGDWKLIHYWESSLDELYNLANDPGEQFNVIEQFPERSSTLKNHLLEALDEMHAATPEPDEEFDVAARKQREEWIRTSLMSRLEEQRKSFLSQDFEPDKTWWDSALAPESK